MIAAREEADRIQLAVRSAAAPGVEVVVVDGESGDDTGERARQAGARVVVASPGRAHQLEAGARATDADVICFLHADTTLPEGYADAIRAALDDPRVVGGAFAFRFAERGAALRVVEWGTRVRSHWGALPYGDQALFVRRSVLDAIGGVPQVPIMEDVDLVLAMRRRGRLALLPLEVHTTG